MDRKVVPLEIISSRVSEVNLESVLQTMDRLHDAATTGRLDAVCALDSTSLVGWLEDIIYTAQEAIREMGEGDDDARDAKLSSVIKLYRQG